ncbi:MAG: DUF3014 domain-containing protein [Acidobacteriota bacterium]
MPDEEKDLTKKSIQQDNVGESAEEKTEEPGEDQAEQKKKWLQTGLIIILILAVAAALYYFLFLKKPGTGVEQVEPSPAIVQEKADLPEGTAEAPAKPPVELDKSDDFVRQWVKELSAHPSLTEWLKGGELVRRFVVAVDNIANGLSPRAHIDFFLPAGDFATIRRGDIFYADPEGYSRYDEVADVFVSLDSRQCVSLFRAVKPLCQEAYRDLGYPNQDFEQAILRAIVELLEAPIVEGAIPLEKAVLNYVILDPELESLSDAQKHLLRMGPENVGAIQTKLREMALALGIAERRLPQTRYYTAPRFE